MVLARHLAHRRPALTRRPGSGRVPAIAQVSQADCGPSALAMVLAGFGVAAPVEQVRERLDAGRDGVTLRDLRDAAREHGLDCRAFARPDLRADPRLLAGLPRPLIAHWEGDHFVVVERVGRRAVHVVDPALGRRRLSFAEVGEHLTGTVLLFEWTHGARPSRPPRGTASPATRPGLRRVRELVLPVLGDRRRLVAGVVLASLLIAGLGLAVPEATRRIVDLLVAGRPIGQGWPAAVAVLAAITGVLSLLRGLAVVALQRRLGAALSGRAVDRLLAAEYRYFERRYAGDLISRVESVTELRDLLAGPLIASALDAVLAAGYLVAVGMLAPGLALAAAGLIVVQSGVAVLLSTRVRNLQNTELLARARQQSRLVDAVLGIAAIRCAGAADGVRRHWGLAFEQGQEAAARRARAENVIASVAAAGQVAAPVLLLLVAARDAAGPGAAVGLASLAAAAVAPGTSLAARIPAFVAVGPLLERLSDLTSARLEQEPVTADADRSRPRPPLRLAGAITLDGVGFRYDRRSPFAVRGVDLIVEPGMKVGVVGGSGSGKSSLVKLLAGLHLPTEGALHYDGHDVREVDRDALRRSLGVVLQEPYLGAGTIREALTLARPDAADAELARVCALAALDDELQALPLRWQTRLGDGGVGLSGGQRQRLALARALLGNPAVLILDEATSALDVVTEARIEANLRGLGITRVVIAHRLSTVRDADLLLVLDRGRVIECGEPGRLAGLGGAYAELLAVPT